MDKLFELSNLEKIFKAEYENGGQMYLNKPMTNRMYKEIISKKRKFKEYYSEIEMCIRDREHARLSIVAVYKKSIDFNIADMMSGQMTIQGSCGYEESDVIEAFQNINGKRTCTPEIVTHHFSIDEAVEAFEFAANPKSGAVKVVIDYE